MLLMFLFLFLYLLLSTLLFSSTLATDPVADFLRHPGNCTTGTPSSRQASGGELAVKLRAFGTENGPGATRDWAGPEWWANPLWDWRVRDGALVGRCGSPARTAVALPLALNKVGRAFSLSVEVSFGAARFRAVKESVAGLRIGRRGRLRDYRNGVVMPVHWFDAVVGESGAIRLGGAEAEERFTRAQVQTGPVKLTLSGRRFGSVVVLDFTAAIADTVVKTGMVAPLSLVRGGLSLLADGAFSNLDSPVHREATFRDFVAAGDLLTFRAHRTFGPIWWAQYTVSAGALRLQAQFAPVVSLNTANAPVARLYVTRPMQKRPTKIPALPVSGAASGGEWVLAGRKPVDGETWTARFDVSARNDNGNDNSNGGLFDSTKWTRYVVLLDWNGGLYNHTGLIRPEPGRSAKLKLGVFSCDRGYIFPSVPAVSTVRQLVRPDMVFFAGDQIYEDIGGYGVPRRTARVNTAANQHKMRLDLVFKVARFGWAWRDVLSNTPSVVLPDDHDVYHPNLWGAGGVALPDETGLRVEQGGYWMLGSFVRAVERIQSGHLPRLSETAPRLAQGAAPDRVLPIGIRPLYTAMQYGGVGFAVLEDRKFKTGPLSLPAATRRGGGAAADLLGSEQERFLRNWAADWTGHELKVAMSQTMFASASTHTGPTLGRKDYNYDSGGWPVAARDRVVEVLSGCGALSLHGDQHLGMLARLFERGARKGERKGEGYYAFMVPGTANGWSRAWWPNGPDGINTGNFTDDAGNPLSVVAVANPDPNSNTLPFIDSPHPIKTARERGSGFGLVVLDKARKTATVNLYRIGARNRLLQFGGFPKTVRLGGKPGGSSATGKNTKE